MNSTPPEREDLKLRSLLRDAHPVPTLPPRFQEGVWRKVESAERSSPATSGFAWLDLLVRTLFRPAYAATGLAAMMLAGGWLGVRDGTARVHEAQRIQYVAAVSPLHRIAP